MVRPSPLTVGDSETRVLAEIDRQLSAAHHSLTGLQRYREVRRLERARDYLTQSRAYLVKDALLLTAIYLIGLVVIGILGRQFGIGTDYRTWAGRLTLIASGIFFGGIMSVVASKAAFKTARDIAADLRLAQGKTL